MRKQTKTKTPAARAGKGRPATGSTRTKISITVPTGLMQAAKASAFKKGESLSQYISRAIQNLTLEA